jgi:hypothetical protein
MISLSTFGFFLNLTIFQQPSPPSLIHQPSTPQLQVPKMQSLRQKTQQQPTPPALLSRTPYTSLASHPPFPIVLNEQKCLGIIRQTVPHRNFTEQSVSNQEDSTSSHLSPTISLLGLPNQNQKKERRQYSPHRTSEIQSINSGPRNHRSLRCLRRFRGVKKTSEKSITTPPCSDVQ